MIFKIDIYILQMNDMIESELQTNALEDIGISSQNNNIDLLRLNFTTDEIIIKLISMIRFKNKISWINNVGLALRNCELENTRELFHKIYPDVPVEIWDSYLRTNYKPGIGVLYLYARNTNYSEYRQFIRELTEFHKRKGYCFHDLFIDLSYNKSCIDLKDENDNPYSLDELEGQVESLLIPRIASCMRFKTGDSSLIILKVGNDYNTYDSARITKVERNYSHLTFPCPIEIEKNTALGPIREIIIKHKPVFTYAKSRSELCYDIIVKTPIIDNYLYIKPKHWRPNKSVKYNNLFV